MQISALKRIQFGNEVVVQALFHCRFHDFGAAQLVGGAPAFRNVQHLLFQRVQIGVRYVRMYAMMIGVGVQYNGS